MQIRKNTNGGQAVYLSWKDGSKVHLQLPFMRTPFGFSAFTDKKTQKVNYSLDLSFDNDDQEAQVLLAKINALDDIMVRAKAKATFGRAQALPAFHFCDRSRLKSFRSRRSRLSQRIRQSGSESP